jgi:hypothetical protein
MRVGENFLGVFALLVAAAVAPANAAPIVYDLTSDHCSGGCAPAGTIFGTVSLNQNGTTVDVTVDLANGFSFAKTGSVDFQSFLFSGVGVAIGDITVDARSPVEAKAAGPFTASGIGTYGFGINCPSCGNGLSGASATNTADLVFHVASATIADLIPASGSPFAADIGNITVGSNFNGQTGPIDASLHTTATPEPITSGLVGTGLIGLFFLRRRAAK